MSGGRLHGLDALRGVAALVVVLFHYELWSGQGHLWNAGWLAVDLFFVLSGYVLSRIYEPRFAEGLSVGRFMAARVRRLWPAYAVGCTVGLAYLLTRGVPHALPSYVLALAFLPTPFIPGFPFAIDQPGWSLTFELVANLIHVAVLAKLPTRRLLVWLGVFIAGFVALAIHNHGIFANLIFEGFPAALFRTMAAYTLGIVLARYARPLPVRGWWAIVAMPASILLLSDVPDVVRVLLYPLVFSPLLLLASLKLSRWSRLATALGALSYPLYAVHDPILLFGLRWNWPGWLTIAAAIACAAGMASLARLRAWRQLRDHLTLLIHPGKNLSRI